MSNNDESKNINLPPLPPPITKETQNDILLQQQPLMEEPSNDIFPPIEELQTDVPVIEELQTDVPVIEELQTDVPISTDGLLSENESNIPISESVLPEIDSESENTLTNEDVLKSNAAEELYQENPIPLPIEDVPIKNEHIEEISESLSSSPIDSIKVEITKEKLDDLLTKISEETVNYLMLLTNFLEKKRQFNTDTEKINKTIEDINKIKDDMMKVLTETELTSNSFDPSSGAQKSQYAEMILGALALTAAVSGGKRKNTKKHKKKYKPSNTKKHNHKKSENKTKINKKSMKKSTTKKHK